MAKQNDSMWARLIKRVLPPNWHRRPAPDEDRNSNTLSRLGENDPVFNCILDHAFAQFSNDLVNAFDTNKLAALRITFLDSAAGIKNFIEDMEMRREGWNEDRIRKLREEQNRKRKT